ncbi:pancreatic lipase-related protein 3-like [Trichoplusia ni]|uniref:Pancreatic lipase-related protein 3-like n=1 Tax=Trichoplusia ni TaxID=7111 RepID=A0A7E5VY43_TRINI|nr:pancreatic lipase-related protein 3-like [Trichoplusia ni]
MFLIVFIINFIYIGIRSTEADTECLAPPMECPNVNVTFWLYTKENEDNPYQVFALNSTSIEEAPWVKGAPVKILIHGYTGYRDFSPNTEIRPAYLKCCNYNIISIDYNPIAREPCYIEAARNTELVGKCTAQLIDQLVQKHDFNLSQFHVIGFSLGGQAAGFIGDYLTSGLLDRITGLDPALPLFVTTDPKKKIDKSDAKFVDVLHTNALEKGKLESSGTVDFYANGGITQPGCRTTREDTKSGCSHGRAPQYYAESINTEVGFYAAKCYSWITYMIGWCELFNSADDVLFGEHVPLDAKGLYFFRTNSEAPYARGTNNKDRRKRSLPSFVGQ